LRDSGVRYTEPVETSVERWRREVEQLERERAAETEKISFVKQLHQDAKRMQRDVAMGLGAVGQLVEAITSRLEGLEDELAKLRKCMDVADARFEDLKKSVDARATKDSQVVDLPNPLARARAS
jgi:chromosome segregation ATPase